MQTWPIAAVPERARDCSKAMASRMHLADRPRIWSSLETLGIEKGNDHQYKSILVRQTFSTCDVMPTVIENQEENLKMNSTKYLCIPLQRKELARAHPVHGCTCLRTSGKGIFTDSHCFCVSLPPVSWVFKLICQMLPNSHTGSAIRTVWGKLCV